jgi:hypothetical protein
VVWAGCATGWVQGGRNAGEARELYGEMYVQMDSEVRPCSPFRKDFRETLKSSFSFVSIYASDSESGAFSIDDRFSTFLNVYLDFSQYLLRRNKEQKDEIKTQKTNFGGPVFGCINADFCVRILILHYFSRSTRLSKWISDFSKFSMPLQFAPFFVSKTLFYSGQIARI